MAKNDHPLTNLDLQVVSNRCLHHDWVSQIRLSWSPYHPDWTYVLSGTVGLMGCSTVLSEEERSMIQIKVNNSDEKGLTGAVHIDSDNQALIDKLNELFHRMGILWNPSKKCFVFDGNEKVMKHLKRIKSGEELEEFSIMDVLAIVEPPHTSQDLVYDSANLTAGTCFHFKVRAFCGDDQVFTAESKTLVITTEDKHTKKKRLAKVQIEARTCLLVALAPLSLTLTIPDSLFSLVIEYLYTDDSVEEPLLTCSDVEAVSFMVSFVSKLRAVRQVPHDHSLPSSALSRWENVLWPS